MVLAMMDADFLLFINISPKANLYSNTIPTTFKGPIKQNYKNQKFLKILRKENIVFL